MGLSIPFYWGIDSLTLLCSRLDRRIHSCISFHLPTDVDLEARVRRERSLDCSSQVCHPLFFPKKTNFINHLQGASKRNFRLRRPARKTRGLGVKVVMRPVKRGSKETGRGFQLCGGGYWEPKSGILCGKCLLGGLSISFSHSEIFFFFVFVLLRTYLVSE